MGLEGGEAVTGAAAAAAARRGSHLLTGAAADLERLRLQALVWEPAAERMLDDIGVAAGWNCIDLGCGAMGILWPLSKRAGPTGRVVGLDADEKLLVSAIVLAEEKSAENVQIMQGDVYATGLPDATFDLSHARFMLAPVGREKDLLREMIRLTKPGGILAVQEPDASSWSCFPENPSWTRLKDAVVMAFWRAGGDFSAGRRTLSLLREAGLEGTQVRAEVVALHAKHPYLRLPVQFAVSLRRQILEAGIMDAAELDRTIEECERIASNPTSWGLTFTLIQTWGRRPHRSQQQQPSSPVRAPGTTPK